MSYELFFEDVLIGKIKYEANDFPNLFGDIAFSSEYLTSNSSKVRRIRDYLNLQAQSVELVEVENEKDVEKELNEMNAKLDQYMDMVETNGWCLISDKGEQLPILSPIIRTDGEVTWRWNIVKM